MDQQPAQQPPASPPVESSSSPAMPTSPAAPSMPQTDMPTQVPPSGGSPSQPATGPVAPPPPQVKKSSNMWLIVVVVLLILAVAGWFLYQTYMNKSTDSTYQMVTSPTAAPSPTLGAVKSGDTKLDQQSDAIDESMMKVETDIKGVDAGLNDKSVDLSQ